MIINPNNKNAILKGMVKRGLNQDPTEIRQRIYNQTHRKNETAENKEEHKMEDLQKKANALREMNQFRKF